ncbi:hypothetical protein H5U98_06795 [Mycolicibacterium boenickei]|uniref:Bacteriophage protein n=1 Tax=Mycolicibacterium boenickei TaxID=146017 RepID=A0AAX3A1J3_9MYCO|nr:hypothetical protein [Mycolicibacterium boenickei]PEG57660.1 hypothetical protein CQY21_26505 [Mycolicibacterium boenickei]UNC01095.1 hypothetical protein H5U98_06795 [Mycolicibacterium boenickei]BBX90938.1 hypothetical protein MBOE_25870 [Mycolicibacterium boenickei]
MSDLFRNLLENPPFGAEGGYNTEGDTLVNRSADGVDLNLIWGEVKAALDAWNAERSAITNLLSYWTVNTADAIPQATNDESFELASEYGEPESVRAPSKHLLLGYTFRDYDKATRFTWKFLRDSTAEQIRAVANYALAADQKLVQGTILERLFSPTAELNEWNHTCYGLYNGDSIVPPAYLGKTFTAPHTHYATSGAATIDSGDLETCAKNVTEHGYNADSGAQLLAFVNPAQGEVISTFRAGKETATDIVAKHDYIPSAGAPAYLQPENLVGQVAPEKFNGLKVSGSYGPLWIIESDFVPEGYFSVAATYGPNHPNNVIGVRQHVNAAYQGLRQIQGKVPGYPLQDSFFSRGFGVGVRHRGAASVMQISANANYTAPVIAK